MVVEEGRISVSKVTNEVEWDYDQNSRPTFPSFVQPLQPIISKSGYEIGDLGGFFRFPEEHLGVYVTSDSVNCVYLHPRSKSSVSSGLEQRQRNIGDTRSL